MITISNLIDVLKTKHLKSKDSRQFLFNLMCVYILLALNLFDPYVQRTDGTDRIRWYSDDVILLCFHTDTW